jgi:3,4-dihydroxy 2-butanone 4-phosphate synthase/GTP cyclohydrolase II
MDSSHTAVRNHSDVFSGISCAADIIGEARAGRMFILVDDENRENEGNLIIPAQFATPDAINFMAKYARGLICLAMTKNQIENLGLSLMDRTGSSRHQTAFTVSIEAKEGVTTGISATDRAHTVAVAINPELGRDHLVTPGHMFPLMAREGGTLMRAGYTEAAVDIARLAGLIPAGVICEIMNDDGRMARLPDLLEFAQFHNLKLGRIADLIAYRRRTERLVRRVAQEAIVDASGQIWRAIAYESLVDNVEHLALVKGDLSELEPIIVRLHAVDTITDTVGGAHFDGLQGAMEMIRAAKRGVLVLIREAHDKVVSDRIRQLVDCVPSYIITESARKFLRISGSQI